MRKQRLFIVDLILLICLFVYGCSPTPSSGEPTLTPFSNLLQNGSFENTGSNWLAPWRFQSNGTATIKQVSDTKANGVYSASVNIMKSSSADNVVQLYQGNIFLTRGESYRFVFWAKASTSRTIRPAILHGTSPWTSYFSQYVTLTTSWQQYTLRFIAPQTDTNGMLVFNMANATGYVWIDNVSLQPTGEPTLTPFSNLLQNGSFENTGSNWLAPWLFQSGGIATIKQVSDTKANGVYSASVNIMKSSSADNVVQLYQGNVPLIGGELYRFVFWAKASTSRTIRPVILHGTSPWTSYFSQYVTLTTSWQQYTLRFVAPQTDTEGMLVFNMANATGYVWIDNVSLQQST